mmetsp:Transcript_86149/g.238782  ORF Transcript_86149/g.238782 Transcript_86149/m.238782 type:complete len:663 (-) Transcript_86149:307-2295(-)
MPSSAPPLAAAARRLLTPGLTSLLLLPLLPALVASKPLPPATGSAVDCCGEGMSATCLRTAAPACPPAGDDDASLLQRSQAARLLKSSTEEVEEAATVVQALCAREVCKRRKRGIAIAFEGGGFLSHADFTGLFMGLIRGLTGMGKFGGLSRLLQKFGVVAGISGGSWYASQLIYSHSIERLTYLGAHLPWLAGLHYNTMFVGPVLNPFRGTHGVIHGLAECIAELRPLLQQHIDAQRVGRREDEPRVAGLIAPWYWQMLAEFIILIQNGHISWSELVQTMFQRGAGIDPELPLGTKRHNAWATGKLAITITTAITPAGPDVFGNDLDLPQVTLYTTTSGDTMYTYSAQNNSENSAAAVSLPAKISVIVGGGEDQPSALPFCSASDCAGYAPSYHYNGESLVADSDFSGFWGTAFEESAGKVSVSASSASSSAFAGATALKHAIDGRQGCLELATWTTGADDGESYEQASELRNKMFQGSLNENLAIRAANAGLQPLIDGGANDLLGVANAVAAGAREVLSVQDVDVQMGVDDQGLADLFEGGPAPGRVVFRSPSSQSVQQRYRELNRIYAKKGSKFLSAIAYGTIPCVTADNPLFGIRGGRSVKLNVLAVETVNITIGAVQQGYSFDSFFNYGTLVGEIAQTMALQRNTKMVRRILSNFFL